MITDQQALLVMGEILAGFLKEHLPERDRWRDHVVPTLRSHPDAHERPLEQLDLSSLLQVFMGAKDLFYQTKVFRTGLPFQLALCVRSMRNSRAHDTYASVLTEDERLFDLHALRRFTMVVDNRAVAPGLIEQFLTALDARILDATQRCLSAAPPAAETTPSSTSRPPEFDEILQVSVRTQEDLASVRERLKEVAERLSEVKQGPGGSAASEAALDGNLSVNERLATIEGKLDQVLAKMFAAATEPTVDEATGEPEHLSLLEAKAALRRLRARLSDEYPDVDPLRQLLRQSMVDMILQRRVADQDAFADKIPEVMRRDTDQRQLESLPLIFEIVNRLRVEPSAPEGAEAP